MTDPAGLPPRPKSSSPPGPERSVGLVGATSVGVGAIVGGGILVLAGVAFQATGPSAIVAFAVNGFVAVLTALSFAEMSTAFPENGGAYTFAKKVLGVRAAFVVGWILWFAYIVAGVLYALGFAEYGVALVRTLWETGGTEAPAWLALRGTTVAVALLPTAAYTLSLIRKATGGGDWATWGKVVVFVVLIAAGVWALAGSEPGTITHGMTPFLPRGFGGLLQAMGFTFIALQGFDLIAAIGGEVKAPNRTIPRAMLLSLGAALVIYLPLLFVTATVGVEHGSSIRAMSDAAPETVMADAAGTFMGPTGYWLVMVAAILSTLSALGANLLAASRIALSMATDRTLPPVLGQLHASRRTPVMAIYATALALVAILLMVPNLAAAGAAASLIFLIAFALAHGTSILARQRSEDRPDSSRSTLFDASQLAASPAERPFRTPWFPLVPAVGGVACVALALFQAVAVPAAGGITAVWLGLGVLLYFALFSGRARAYDAFAEAHDPTLARMRGHSPLVLVPIANPANAPGMVDVAAALAPPHVGRVMLLSVVRPPADEDEDMPPESVMSAHLVVRQALEACFRAGHRPEALMTIASQPWREIGRVARAHRCEGLLLGMTQAVERISGGHLEDLLNSVDCDVAFLKSPDGWKLAEARRILVPIGGRGGHVELRARLLGSLERTSSRELTWLTAIGQDATDLEERTARRMLLRFAEDKTLGETTVDVARTDDAAAAIIARSGQHDLIVLGLHSQGGRRVFGEFALRVVREASCAVILISRRA